MTRSTSFTNLPDDVVRRIGDAANAQTRARLASTHREARRVLPPTAQAKWLRLKKMAGRFRERALYAFLVCVRGVLAVARSHAVGAPAFRGPAWTVSRAWACRRVSVAEGHSFCVRVSRENQCPGAQVHATGLVELGRNYAGAVEFWQDPRGAGGQLFVWFTDVAPFDDDGDGLNRLSRQVSNETRVGNRSKIAVTVAHVLDSNRHARRFSCRGT